MGHVKSSCENLDKALIDELHGRFPNHELISALGVIYQKIWFKTLIMLVMIFTDV